MSDETQRVIAELETMCALEGGCTVSLVHMPIDNVRLIVAELTRLRALAVQAEPVAWEPHAVAVHIGAEVRRRNRLGKADEAGSISPSCELAATILVLEALRDRGYVTTTPPPTPPSAEELTMAGAWEIDRSTENPILTYEKCSVIQDEPALYVLRLIHADKQPAPPSVKVPSEAEDLIAAREAEFKNAMRLLTHIDVAQYLLANTRQRLNGAQKAHLHERLTMAYIAAIRGCDLHRVRRRYEAEYKAVHDATAEALTNRLDVTVGFDLDGFVDDAMLERFFEIFHSIALIAIRNQRNQRIRSASASGDA